MVNQKSMSRVITVFVISALLYSCNQDSNTPYAGVDWPAYHGDKTVSHYSKLDQITKENVSNLKVAWSYDGGDADPKGRSQIQCNPLIIDGILYGASASRKLFALNAATGKKVWQFDADKDSVLSGGVSRGLVYWEDEKDSRLFYGTGQYLFAIDSSSGKLIEGFGDGGKIDLKKNLDRNVEKNIYTLNTPGIIYNDLYIVGGRLSEGAGHIPGHIRAYDVRTGKMKWIFHTIPHPGEYGYETWPKDAYLKSGGANSWAGFSLDQERGIVYAPTGSASFDFYGGDRIGENLFANCIIALEANTGKRIWHYQTIHHDMWDRDLPSPPNLLTIDKDGEKIDVVAQITKSGYLFVLNRDTGEPIYPIEERPVAKSTLDGEEAWPTQPFPTVYPPFSRTNITEDDLAMRSEEAKADARRVWENNSVGENFLPPSVDGTVIFPGFDGGGEWGGAAIDPSTNTIFVNSNEVSWHLDLTPNEMSTLGNNVYKTNCQNCHGSDLKGSEMFGKVPELTNVANTLSRAQIIDRIKNGKGVMPPFKMLSDKEINSVVDFLSGTETDTTKVKAKESWPYPYYFNGYKKHYAEDGLPIIKPPWGQLTAVDLNSAKIKWQIPFGNIDSLNIPGFPITGTENYGGPVATSSGVLFIAATTDKKMRAFDQETGKQLWEADLPAPGYATPATYSVDGKQYVVIACGGGKLGSKSGDSYVAFSLP
ncbi:MAG: quinoprotein glucose dehydrogenase [Cyclobacteriaceae bacterium]|jgi:quinoprotein glucose dehydrogenase